MKKIVIIFIFIISFTDVLPQAPLGEIDDYYYLPGMDTVRTTRTYSEWWFGVSAGVNGNMYFGDFFLPERPYLPVDDFNVMIDFPLSLGAGLFLGIFGEWVPRESKWGANLNIYLLDFRSSSTESEPYNDSVNTRYQSTYTNNYISISPSAIYHTAIEGLDLYGGFDAEINLSSEISHRKTFDNSAEIDHDIIFNTSSFSSRFGFHFGVGYDILIADISNKVRAFMTPYIMLHGGTNSYSDYSSSRNQLMIRAGVFIKIGFDNIERDTLLFDQNYTPPSAIIASVLQDESIKFTYKSQPIAMTSELAIVQIQRTIDALDPSITEAELDAKEKPRLTLRPNDKKVFTFNSNLTNSHRRLLEDIAYFLKQNAGTRIAIRGYSDNRGTLQEMTKRSSDRANVVKAYLMSLGSRERQLLPTGMGSFPPIGDNNTAAGRAKNRRVEIQIVPNF